MGRALGVLETRGILRDHMKPQWTTPLKIYYTGEGRPIQLAMHTERSGWTLQAENLAKVLPGVTAEELYREFTAADELA